MRARLLALAALLVASCGERSAEPQREIVVFAAASAADALRAIAEDYEGATGRRVVVNAAASSTLAAQIRAGAAADLFLSADGAWMDELDAAQALRVGTRRDLLANDLVLVGGAAAEPFEIDLSGPIPPALAAARRIAIADPAHVPAGRYAKEALVRLGWWEAIEPRMLAAADARATLRLVELGEASFGLVYATDARASQLVRTVATLPHETHRPIVYPIAALASAGDGTEAFLDYLGGEEARRAFEAAGFRMVDAP